VRHMKNKNGLTLVELIVTLVIMGIVFGGIVSAFMLGSNLFNSASSKFDEHNAALSLTQKIQNEVTDAKTVAIYSDTSYMGTAAEADKLYFDTTVATPDERGLVTVSAGGSSAFMQGAFAGYDCTVTFIRVDVATLGVSVTIKRQKDASDSYAVSTNIALANVAVAKGTIGGVSSGGVIGFTPYAPPASGS
jgi:prepilin-type N-terminal cleavage/methylation domain-containing protein